MNGGAAVPFVDALGRTVRLPRTPRRIVSLVPSITEALFAFGLGEAVAGVTHFCVEPREGVAAKPKVGGTKTVDVARVQELEPDLVVASAEENRREEIEALMAAGLPVYVTLPTTVEGAVEMLRALAEMTGAWEAAGPILREAEEAVEEARAAHQGRRPLTVFCPVWRDPWVTIGPDTYMHDFIALCGGANIFADRRERYPQVKLAEMAERAPEVILLPSEPYRFRRRHLPELEAYREVPAVRDGRIYFVDGRELCWYGPRIAASLRSVRRLLWGEGVG